MVIKAYNVHLDQSAVYCKMRRKFIEEHTDVVRAVYPERLCFWCDISPSFQCHVYLLNMLVGSREHPNEDEDDTMHA